MLFVILFYCILGWHNHFNHRVDKVHPNSRHFIDVLKKEEVRFRHRLLHAKSGLLKKKSKRTCIIQERLDVLYRHFSNNEIDLNEYLEGLSMIVAKDMNKKK